MAQKAKKDLAKSNAAALNTLHLTSLALNLSFLLLRFLFHRFQSRSLTLYILLSTPSLIAQYILERSGRPKYSSPPPNSTSRPSLISAGEDLAAPGLTEYLFDVIWVTWACLVLVVFVGNWAWGFYAVVPAFALYKGWGLLGMARGMMGGAAQGQVADEKMMMQGEGNRKQRRKAAA